MQDVNKCKDCGAKMMPLAYSLYCPNDCDKKLAEPAFDPDKTPPYGFRFTKKADEASFADLNEGPPFPGGVDFIMSDLDDEMDDDGWLKLLGGITSDTIF